MSTQPNSLAEVRARIVSSGGAADLVSLNGRRMIIDNETDKNRKISRSAVKQLTGGDTIKARPLYHAVKEMT
ncbi:MAG: hypothetical protein KAT62_00595 [Desulfuromonadales bacterium]|nr:hypothetical protein [Desulfuromonadales bacterium]